MAEEHQNTDIPYLAAHIPEMCPYQQPALESVLAVAAVAKGVSPAEVDRWVMVAPVAVAKTTATKALKEPLYALDPDHIASHNSLVVLLLPVEAREAVVLHFPLVRSIMMNMYRHTFSVLSRIPFGILFVKNTILF